MRRDLLSNKLGTLWCGLMHESVTWPIHGHYQCRACGRTWPAPWSPPVSALRGSLLILVVATAIAPPIRAAAPAPDPEAAVAFARFTTQQAYATPWELETIQIEASLPKLSKSGHLQAIRRFVPLHHPKFQDIQITGDTLVKDQVIVRYLKAELHASEMPAASVAITPANYKFAYRGANTSAGRPAYVFQIVPRQKREGLIKGELWLDAETGAPLRESGYFVKRPSIFLKRVEVTRENTLHDGAVESRLTHVTVDTRLVGRAELVIAERPLNAPEVADPANE